jgi:hypothetical protein
MYSDGRNDDGKSNLGIRDEGGKKTVHALSAGVPNLKFDAKRQVNPTKYSS